ncbi:hypothetical protein ACFPIJ_49205 [Dactylosporangium cerinum]|uniref:Uncharacterized protein n=1 Tax=Dactylosporangium cerinum TaxID=1434730 RepID=A0ABV9WEA1_9ACTN
MRDTTLGRWMTRLAVTVGVAVAALGLSATVAQASVTDSEASPVKLASVVRGFQVSTEPVYVTESWDWN